MKILVISLFGLLLLVGILCCLKNGRINRLKRRYMQLTHQNSQVAAESLQWQFDKLKTKTPGKTEEWYLEKIIFDLERDRHR